MREPLPLRSHVLTIACAVLLLLGVFLFPYYFSVVPTVSLSYLVGFNNRVAVAFFLLFAFGIAVARRGWIGEGEQRNSKLPNWLLGTSVSVAVALCIVLRLHRHGKPIGGEAHFFLDRIHQLSLHRLPYRDFEFTYGPLLLYPTQLVHQALGISLISAYYVVWTLFWAAGIGMLYFVVNNIDIATEHRLGVYMLMAVTIPPALIDEGMNYAPLRPFTVPFLALCTYIFWQRTKAPYRTACLAGFCIAAGFAVSAEQGIGLLVGTSAYFFLLAFRSNDFPVLASVLQLGLSAIVAACAAHLKLFAAMGFFSKGGYNFPVLLSPGNLLAMTAFVLAICLLWRAIATRDLRHNYVLLTLCGIPMLPAAMGRNDFGHMISVTSILLVGLFAIYSRVTLRRYLSSALWVTVLLACYGGVVVTGYHKLRGDRPPVATDPSELHSRPIPRTVMYYAPYSTALSQTKPEFLAYSLDEGYYSAFQNITTEEQIRNELLEFQQHKGMPFLLPDEPGATTPALWDQDPKMLRLLEVAPFLPRVKHAQIDTRALADFINQYYRRTDMAEDGKRVWIYAGAH
jgi:hypothetical protein